MKLWENVKNGYFIIDEMHNIPYDDAMICDDEDYYDDLEEEINPEEINSEDEEKNSEDEDLQEDNDTEMESDQKEDEEQEQEQKIEEKSPMNKLLHSDARIMFMSATPRLFEESDETAEGMDIDNELFGEVDYQYPMGKAIDDGHICDYMIYVPTMSIKKDEGLDTVIEELQIKDYNRELLVKARFIIRGCMATGSKKCIIYCIEQNECSELMKIIKELCESYFAIDCWCDTITSTDSRDARKKKLGYFANVSEKAFLCSVQILNECIDIPECDSIFITYASKSRIRNIQRLCRANRKDMKNPNKIASVFLWCDEYAEMASFMKHIKEYDSRFSFEKVKRINGSDANCSGIMKVGDCSDDKKVLDGVIVGFKSVASWYENLEKVKKYIDENGKRPTQKTNKELCSWITYQIKSSKERKYIMKIDEIYSLWNNFVNDARYKQYFDLDNIRDWKIKLEEVLKNK
jgi:superfamily II DNA or RNA helicase